MNQQLSAVAITPDGKRALVVKAAANEVALLDIDGTTVTYKGYDMTTGVFPTMCRSRRTAAEFFYESPDVVAVPIVPPRLALSSIPPEIRVLHGRLFILTQLEQPHRVSATDLKTIWLADGAGIEPTRGVIDILERPVDGKHDAI